MALLIIVLATVTSCLAHEVVYVPVCGPDCCKSHIGNLPLGDHGQTYHPHLDVGSAHLYSAKYSQGQHLSESAHLKYSQGYQHDSAQVYQHNNHHLTEHKQTIHHHGSGVSQLAFEQEHHHGVGDELGEHHHHDDDHHHKKKNVHYKFEYSVEDHKTGDVKRHKEERKGDEVNGEYSLLEEDGNVRTVKYFADWKTGFHAQVHNSKLG